MGLAVLPARLKEELELLAEYILEGKDISSNEKIEKHAAWVAEFLPKYDNLDKDNIQDVLRKKSVMYSFMYLRMPAYINALLKAEKHL